MNQDQPVFFNAIARYHHYWGRSDALSLTRIFMDLKPGACLFDPFCGSGTALICALQTGARVIGSDLNPMAVFLSRVKIQSVGLPALSAAFETIKNNLEKKINARYALPCPDCGKQAFFLHLTWNSDNKKNHPFAGTIHCSHCGFIGSKTLTGQQVKGQILASDGQPDHWYPNAKIPAGQPDEPGFFYKLFTKRNLSGLADILHEINRISSPRIRENLHYVFTAMLHGCSSLQRAAKAYPHDRSNEFSSGFGLPDIHLEENVWQAFERRFNHLLQLKTQLNSRLGQLAVSGDIREFETSYAAAALIQSDYLSHPGLADTRITHLFLDPPYNASQNAMALSRFWGIWLKMKFDTASAWHPGSLSMEDNRLKLAALLSRAGDTFNDDCRRILVHRPNSHISLEALTDTASDHGFIVQRTGSMPEIPVPETEKSKVPAKANHFQLILKKRTGDTRLIGPTKKKKHKWLLFARAVAFLYNSTSLESILEQSGRGIKRPLDQALAGLKPEEVQPLIADPEINRKAYCTLSLTMIRELISEDGYCPSIHHADQFDPAGLSDLNPDVAGADNTCREMGIDFIFSDDRANQLLFCFYDPARAKVHRELARAVQVQDQQSAQKRCFLIVPDQKTLDSCRKAGGAVNWPGGLFICTEELIGKTFKGNVPEEETANKVDTPSDTRHGIRHFKARVIKNSPIGTDRSPNLYRLQVETNDLKAIEPGQFVMVDTLPWQKRKKMIKSQADTDPATPDEKERSKRIQPASFLKRPFGIEQLHYPHVKPNFLKYFHLPEALADLTYLAHPHRFDIIYQIVAGGIGTNELKTLRGSSTETAPESLESSPERTHSTGQSILMLGPLGHATDLSRWHARGIHEIHLIGGGVGMAPLIFFAQKLKLNAYDIKAFIGTDQVDSLFVPSLDKPPPDRSGNSLLYIDELSNIGIARESLFVSTEKKTETAAFQEKILPGNYHHGLITQIYSTYLEGLKQTEHLGIITCGPIPMMKALRDVISGHGISMEVLMEKRMGCGIGVCMSCVCRTQTDGKSLYSRVCVDGPLFDANNLDWEKL